MATCSAAGKASVTTRWRTDSVPYVRELRLERAQMKAIPVILKSKSYVGVLLAKTLGFSGAATTVLTNGNKLNEPAGAKNVDSLSDKSLVRLPT